MTVEINLLHVAIWALVIYVTVPPLIELFFSAFDAAIDFVNDTKEVRRERES